MFLAITKTSLRRALFNNSIMSIELYEWAHSDLEFNLSDNLKILFGYTLTNREKVLCEFRVELIFKTRTHTHTHHTTHRT